MPYKLITGEFHIFYPDLPQNGPEPDGDTLKFKPDNPNLVEQLDRPAIGPGFNSRGMVNLRFEAVDALETHYKGMHQNWEWADNARQAMLEKTGFGQVTFWDHLPQRVKTVENQPIKGYVLATTLDTHGRIIAFVFTGDPPFVDGSDIFLDAEQVEKSLNAQLIKEGLVYPLFYNTLPMDLIAIFRKWVIQARQNNIGLWPHATADPNHWAEIADGNTLSDLVIWPKMYRRLAAYFAAGHTNLDQFDNWLRAGSDDSIQLPNREMGNLHDIIEIQGNRFRHKFHTDDLIVQSGSPALTSHLPAAVIERGDVRLIAALVNPTGQDRSHETATILNTQLKDVDLNGWAIADRSNRRDALKGILKSGDTLRVPLSKVRLNNNGDTITLFHQNSIVDQVSYKPTQVKKEGMSVVF